MISTDWCGFGHCSSAIVSQGEMEWFDTSQHIGRPPFPLEGCIRKISLRNGDLHSDLVIFFLVYSLRPLWWADINMTMHPLTLFKLPFQVIPRMSIMLKIFGDSVSFVSYCTATYYCSKLKSCTSWYCWWNENPKQPTTCDVGKPLVNYLSLNWWVYRISEPSRSVGHFFSHLFSFWFHESSPGMFRIYSVLLVF